MNQRAQWVAWRGRKIALAYDKLAEMNPAALPSWRAMAAEEARQYDKLARVIRCEHWHGAGQAYAGSADMRADVLGRRHLYVYAGGLGHPCRDAGEVFRGRAVHDITAHAVTGADFSACGELAAFQAQARLFSARALPALACDNLGQTFYFYFHPINAGKPNSARVWPAQKVDFLPPALWEDLILHIPRKAAPCAR